MKQHVYIIGSKGIPARYGGFETFVDNLTKYQTNENIKYHVACLYQEGDERGDKETYEYHNAECFVVKVPRIGAAKAVVYDVLAFHRCIRDIRKNKIKSPIIYVLACRMGPFIWYYKLRLKLLGGQYYVNPDGHEWKRDKWNSLVKKYWKISERMMIKHSDLAICDSVNIEHYIKNEYKQYAPKTTFIAYGADIDASRLTQDDESVKNWYQSKGVTLHNYYLLVGRMVPENNYETVLREFVQSKSDKDLVIISTKPSAKFEKQLRDSTEYYKDKRVKFVGTVYDRELLKYIRENAFAYIHGHEVGGTNPSLLEALGSTKLNILLDVGFNKEVAKDGALYFDKTEGNMVKTLERAEALSQQEIDELSVKAKKWIHEHYSHLIIEEKYERIFG